MQVIAKYMRHSLTICSKPAVKSPTGSTSKKEISWAENFQTDQQNGERNHFPELKFTQQITTRMRQSLCHIEHILIEDRPGI